MASPETQPSLYERLGGIYSIATVVDDFIDRIMNDPRINTNPAVNEAHHKVPPAGFKYLVTEMVGWASGGPQKYTGRPMRESHEHLNITPKEWDAFMDDFQQTLDKFGVPAAEQAELKAIVNSTYGDIVIGKWRHRNWQIVIGITATHSPKELDMSMIGKVDSLWRYPVKSMRGEELEELFAAFPGIYGDRVFAFRSSANHKGFPYLTARDQRRLLQYRPRFRFPDKAARPINLIDAESKNANPLSADLVELVVDVDTPDGKRLAIDDPALIDMLRADIDQKHQVTLMQSQRAMTDCRPVSIFSLQSARQLAEETETPVDKRRFRANVYVDLASSKGFAENELVGRSVRIGSKVIITVLERDPRCVVITLDPDTGEQTSAILKKVAQAHEGMAGVYGAVLVEGMLHKGDSVELLD